MRFYRSLLALAGAWGFLMGCMVLALGAEQAPEFRGLWVDAFHAGFRTPSEVRQLLADARAGNFNAVLVEVRKRGDAYYSSRYEPWATDISPAGYDPLADLIAGAHDTNAGPRIEVHAWIVTYNIWNRETNAPPQPDHPYNLHPDWLNQTSQGLTWDNGNYAFDPGHPEAQRHTFNVVMDLVANYDLDGLNFDYIRYAGIGWGYNPVSVARFNRRHGRTGKPLTTDPDWIQFRRDQITSLLRKVYLSAAAIKPQLKISADTITWAPGPLNAQQWTNDSAAYNTVLQDWRSWMQEGILDMNIPMAYFQQPTIYSNAWSAWTSFAKDHAYNRHVAIGPGIYMNTLSNALFQMRDTRQPSPSGRRAQGVVGYSYAATSNDKLPRATFLDALTDATVAELYQADAEPLFRQWVEPPVMPWKVSPATGHIKGLVWAGTETNVLDGAEVLLEGAVNRRMLTDAGGFYGFVDLPPGNYRLTAGTNTSAEPTVAWVSVTNGLVTTTDLPLASPPIILDSLSSVTVTQGAPAELRVRVAGSEPLTFFWRQNGRMVPGGQAGTLVFPQTEPAHAGSYLVTVSNRLGVATSASALLTVLPAQPYVVRNLQSLPDGRVQFSVEGSPGFRFRIESSVNLTVWVPLLIATNQDGHFQYIDVSTNYSRRFYRTQILR